LGVSGVGVSCVILGLTPTSMFWLGLVSVFTIGFMISLTDAPISAIMQATVPPQMQGRVFGLLGSLFALTTPIGLAIVLWVGDTVSIPALFLLAGIVCMGVVLVCASIPALRNIEDHVVDGGAMGLDQAMTLSRASDDLAPSD